MKVVPLLVRNLFNRSRAFRRAWRVGARARGPLGGSLRGGEGEDGMGMGRCGEEHLAPEEETLEDRWKLGAISVIICDPSPPGQTGPLSWQKSHSSARFTLIITLADTWNGFVNIRGTN